MWHGAYNIKNLIIIFQVLNSSNNIIVLEIQYKQICTILTEITLKW